MDARVQQPDNERESTEYMDPAHVGKILFDSFEYSQGDRVTQMRIFHRLHELCPELKINPNDLKTIENQVIQRVLNYTMPKSRNSAVMHVETVEDQKFNEDFSVRVETRTLAEADFVTETSDRLRSLAGVFDGTFPRIGDRNLSALMCEDMINKDHSYKDGRPRNFDSNRRSKEHDPSRSPKTDPHASHVCDYIIRRYKVGLPEFNTLFDDIQRTLVTSIQNGTLSSESKQKLNDVINFYDEFHNDRNVRGLLEELTGMTSQEIFG